jgi:hypothetical protein
MKITKIVTAAACAVLLGGGMIWAADHNDAPAVKGTSEDITDLYAFQGSNASNLVFVANTQGLLSPAASATASFDPNTLIQINIDNNGDNVEDLVIQAIYDGKNMNFYGPVAPSITGLKSKLEGPITASVAVTSYGSSAPVTSMGTNGIQVFAGPRDDPFFFDLDQFHKILAGTASGFNNPGADSFAGTNVMSVVVEVPKSLLGAPASGAISTWVMTKKKL